MFAGSDLKKLAIRSLGVILFLTLITYLSLADKPLGGYGPRFLDFENADKLVHFFMYSTFCLFALWAYYPYIHRKRTFAAIIFSIVLYGALMEIFQGYVVPSGRTFSLWDIVANTIGVGIAVSVYNQIHRIF